MALTKTSTLPKAETQEITNDQKSPFVEASNASVEKKVFSIYVAAKDKKAAKKTGEYIANYVEKKYKIPTMIFLDKLEKPKFENAQVVAFFVNEELFSGVNPKNIKEKIKSAVVEFTGTFPKRVGQL